MQCNLIRLHQLLSEIKGPRNPKMTEFMRNSWCKGFDIMQICDILETPIFAFGIPFHLVWVLISHILQKKTQPSNRKDIQPVFFFFFFLHI